MNSWIDLHALWRIVVIGLAAGAGLPALFAVGLRALAWPAPGHEPLDAGSTKVVGGSRVGVAVAALCFAVVLGGAAWGVYLIVQGS